jgi:tRNA nucleotidyltransferase/poly(A) polymerase
MQENPNQFKFEKPLISNSRLNLVEDAKNRDFTMNALYFDLEELKILDPL